jgi:hypothetical protein
MAIEKKIMKSPQEVLYNVIFFHVELADSITSEGPGAGAMRYQEPQMEIRPN